MDRIELKADKIKMIDYEDDSIVLRFNGIKPEQYLPLKNQLVNDYEFRQNSLCDASLQELKEKAEKWDRMRVSSKNNYANVEELEAQNKDYERQVKRLEEQLRSRVF